MPGSDVAEGPEQRRARREILREEERVPAPYQARWWMTRVVTRGEEALRERAVGDDQPPGLRRVGEQVPLRAPRDQVVLDLIRQHGPAERLFRRLPLGEREVADTDLPHEPPALDPAHSLHGRGDGHDRVRPVHLVQIDRLDAEARRARPSPLLDHGGDREDREDLRCQEGVAPAAAERGAEDPLRTAEAVRLGRVDEVDPEIEGARHDRRRLAARVRRPVAPLPRSELPGAEPDRR